MNRKAETGHPCLIPHSIHMILKYIHYFFILKTGLLHVYVDKLLFKVELFQGFKPSYILRSQKPSQYREKVVFHSMHIILFIILKYV